ncbi:MAG: hypothetical protein MUD01_09580 [Chloroflexaceae bacterium]|jgi:DNA-binding NtrC family response regulator|nr:hypothetical protein [Chloroflexaceae bacterium]
MQANVPPPIPCLVAVVNSSADTLFLVQETLQDEGFLVVTGYVADFRQGRADLEAHFNQHQPHVVLWDISVPYEENWRFFDTNVVPTLAAHACPWLLTTTNGAALNSLVGQVEAIEILGKPFDLDQLVEVTKRLVQDGPCERHIPTA